MDEVLRRDGMAVSDEVEMATSKLKNVSLTWANGVRHGGQGARHRACVELAAVAAALVSLSQRMAVMADDMDAGEKR